MNPNNAHPKRSLPLPLVLATVILACVFGSWFWLTEPDSTQPKPLYWVAPMDANYRRDEPGLSPMGMALVPVYEDSNSQVSPGVVNLSPEVQNKMGVRSTVVERKPLNITLRTHGQVVFDSTQVNTVSSRVTGWIDTLFVATEGETVKRGQALYSLYSPELIEVQQAFLHTLGKGSKSAQRQSESTLRALKLDDISLAQLRDEQVAQRSVVFRAEKDGVVGMLNISEDAYVEPGDTLMAIGSLEQVWVELNVFESQASLIRPDQLITLTAPAYPSLVWEGTVDYIYPALSARERSLRFRSVIDNPMMRLKPNMHVQGMIQLEERDPHILVPRQSVIQLANENRLVLNLGEGRFKSIAVTLGESNSQYVEVLEGLEEGDEIVVSAQFLIDSESSKTSDFMRMSATSATTPKYPPTWVKAIVKDIDLVERKIRLQHEYIDAWNMPSMTMRFQATDDLDLHNLELEQSVKVQITDGDPLFQVKAIYGTNHD